MKNNVLRFLSWSNILIGIILLVSIRIKGYGLTEGEIFITFFPYWLIMGLCTLAGYAGLYLANKE